MKTNLTTKLNWKTILMFALSITTCAPNTARADAASEAYARMPEAEQRAGEERTDRTRQAEERREYERKAKEHSDRLVESDNKPNKPAISQSGKYAAIAYSPSTKKWGSAYRFPSLAEGERSALARCDSSDATVVSWARDGWYCAFATGADGIWAHASAATAAKASAEALARCRKVTTTACKVEVCVSSR